LKVSDSRGENLVFILGCARSGTTWLQRLLASHPRVRTGIESNLFWGYLGPPIRQWTREMTVLRKGGPESAPGGLVNYLRDDQFSLVYDQYVAGLMQPMVASLGPGDIFIEKTPEHVLWIPEIMSVLPNCRIIHVLRDCRDVVCSILARSRNEGGHWPRKARGAAKFWVERVEAAFRGGEKFPNQFFEVRYEQLKATPVDTLKKVGDFLGLTWNEDLLGSAVRRNDARTSDTTGTEIPVYGEVATGGYESKIEVIREKYGKVRRAEPGSWKDELTFREKYAVWRVARKTMEKAGYSWKYPW
jgi:hypothetical protein